MHSAIATTYETFDMHEAAEDLCAQIRKKFPEVKNKCGILFADPDYDLSELLPALQQNLDMKIVGCTSAAMLSSQGYHTICATLLVLGGDDCLLGSAISTNLSHDTAEKELRDTYERALEQLHGQKPKVIFTFSAADSNCAENMRLDILEKITDDVPIFGGVAADHFEFSRTLVFADGQIRDAGMVILLIGGKIKPLFIMRNVVRKQLSKAKITSSSGNVVHTINDIPAYDYMIAHGADATSAMSLHFTPLLVETQEGDDEGEFIICRPFFTLDPDTGSGTTISEIPVGSAVTVQTIQSDDILEASKAAMLDLVKKIQAEPSHVYSTVFVISCAARHMVLAVDKEKEAELARKILPADLTFAGFYSFGEFCPIGFINNKADNRVHNLSLALCAL